MVRIQRKKWFLQEYITNTALTEITILTDYIENEICPLFENNQVFDTDEKRKGLFAKSRIIINGGENMRIVRKFVQHSSRYPEKHLGLLGHKLKAGSSTKSATWKEPAPPQFEVNWTKFLSLIGAESIKAKEDYRQLVKPRRGGMILVDCLEREG